MLRVDHTVIDSTIKSADSKVNKGKDNCQLYLQHVISLANMTDILRDFSEYEMGQVVKNNEHWISSRSQKNITNYRRGDIVIVDLGAHNFSHEPSFPHPCIVVKSTYTSALVVPCSSKKYGSGYSEIIDATTADGFSKNTGVQSTSYRWISKSRITGKLGSVSNRILDQLDEKMLSHIPKHKLLMNQKKCEINDLKQKIESLNNKVRQKDEEIALLRSQLARSQEAATTLDTNKNNQNVL